MELGQLTRDEVLFIMPLAKNKVDTYLPYLNKYAPVYGVTTTLRMAHFLAQIAQESGQLKYVRELASGAAYDTGKKAQALGNTPEKDGDGQRYKGRGLIQITGRTNYKAVSKALGVDFIAHPEKLEEPEYAVASAYWYWQSHGCNELADLNDSVKVTRRINGGTNGLDDRLRYLGRAKEVFKI
jgi:putative chitinase